MSNPTRVSDALRDSALDGWLAEPVDRRFKPWLPKLRNHPAFRATPAPTLGEVLHAPWPSASVQADFARAVLHAAKIETRARELGLPAPGTPLWSTWLGERRLGWLGEADVRSLLPSARTRNTVTQILEDPRPAPLRDEVHAAMVLAVDRHLAPAPPLPDPPGPAGRRLVELLELLRTHSRTQIRDLRLVDASGVESIVVTLTGADCEGRTPGAHFLFESGEVDMHTTCAHGHVCDVVVSAVFHAAAWLATPAGREFEAKLARPAWQNALERVSRERPAAPAFTAVVDLAQPRVALRAPDGSFHEAHSGRIGYDTPEFHLLRLPTFERRLLQLATYPRVEVDGRPTRITFEPLAVRAYRDGDVVRLGLRVGDWSGGIDALAALPHAGRLSILPSPPGTLRLTSIDDLSTLAHLLRHTFPLEATSDLLAAASGYAVEVERDESLAGQVVDLLPRPILHLTFDAGTGLRVRLRFAGWGDEEHIAGQGAPSRLVSDDGVLCEVRRSLETERRVAADLVAALDLAGNPRWDGDHTWLVGHLPDAIRLVQTLEGRDDVTVRWHRPLVVRALSPKAVRIDAKPMGAWLGLTGEAEEGGPSLTELLEAIRSRRGYVVVRPGEVLTLAEPHFAALERLAAVAEPDPRGGLRVGGVHARALDADLAGRIAGLPPEHVEPAEVAVPETLRAELRPYQVEGFRYLARRATWAPGAVLADDMGLGKTVQAIAFLCTRPGPALVVAPTSVVPNWRAELARFAPHLKVVDFRAAGRSAPQPGEVVVCSWDLLVRDEEDLAKHTFDVAIFDEAHAVKNPRTRRAGAAGALDARFRVALTGTPVENRLSELWSLFSVVVPGLLPREDLFRARFQVPIERDRDADRLERLRAIVHPFLLRRKKAEVAAFLPPKTEVVETVELPPAERAVYGELRRAAVAALAGAAGPTGRIKVLAALTRLRQAACDARLLEPTRRTTGPKVARMVELVAELAAEGARTLVFSEFTSLLDLCEPALGAAGIPFVRLDGSTPSAERARVVASFQSGTSAVFLLSRKAGGTGLNLTAASAVIHLDPWWNPAVEDQATDRAHRLGQDKPVTVVRLVSAGTLEERVLAMHADKRALVAGVLDGAGVARLLEVGELLALLADEAPPPARPRAPKALAAPKRPAATVRDRSALQALHDGLDRLPASGLAPSTQDAYRSAARRFEAWLADNDRGDPLGAAIGRYLTANGEPKLVRSALVKLLRLALERA